VAATEAVSAAATRIAIEAWRFTEGTLEAMGAVSVFMPVV
jgi:hypothetical protein